MRSVWRVAVLVLLGLGLTGCMWLFPPLQAVLTASVTSGTAPLSVTFNLAGSTGQIASYTLAFGDASTPATGTDITGTVVHTYALPGTYTATLTVEDNHGRTDSDTVVITVTSPPPEITSFTATPPTGPAPLPVDLDFAAVAGAGRKIVRYTLFFGDTTSVTEPGLNYAHPTPLTRSIFREYVQTGSYTAVLEVWDDLHNTAVQTHSVIVTD